MVREILTGLLKIKKKRKELRSKYEENVWYNKKYSEILNELIERLSEKGYRAKAEGSCTISTMIKESNIEIIIKVKGKKNRDNALKETTDILKNILEIRRTRDCREHEELGFFVRNFLATDNKTLKDVKIDVNYYWKVKKLRRFPNLFKKLNENKKEYMKKDEKTQKILSKRIIFLKTSFIELDGDMRLWNFLIRPMENLLIFDGLKGFERIINDETPWPEWYFSLVKKYDSEKLFKRNRLNDKDWETLRIFTSVLHSEMKKIK